MQTVREQIRSCIFMINRYKKLANDCLEWYDNLADFYVVYDHYMLYVEYYEDMLERIFE